MHLNWEYEEWETLGMVASDLGIREMKLGSMRNGVFNIRNGRI